MGTILKHGGVKVFSVFLSALPRKLYCCSLPIEFISVTTENSIFSIF